MTNEENRYGYDELRWLAQDTHKRRRHAIWWTGGLVLGSMALATAYVSRDSEGGSTPPDRIAVDLVNVPKSLNDLNENLTSLVAALKDLKNEDPVSLTFATEVRPPSSPAAQPDSGIYVNRVIWLVEGSRRFAMTENDILWIPEADRWLRLVTIGTEPDPGPRTEVEVWRPNAPPSPNAPKLQLPKSWRVTNNTANCVRISSDGPSQDPPFVGNGYVAINVFFFTSKSEACPDNP